MIFRRVALQAGAAIVVGGYAWWAVGLPPFSAAATVAVLSAGGLAVIAGASGPRASRVGMKVQGAGPWLVLALVAGLWQFASYLQEPRADHPTLSSLTNELLDSRPGRAVAFIVWVAVAVWLSRR